MPRFAVSGTLSGTNITQIDLTDRCRAAWVRNDDSLEPLYVTVNGQDPVPDAVDVDRIDPESYIILPVPRRGPLGATVKLKGNYNIYRVRGLSSIYDPI
jgi:hypothetical protein